MLVTMSMTVSKIGVRDFPMRGYQDLLELHTALSLKYEQVGRYQSSVGARHCLGLETHLCVM